jgi:hypothetical protein
MHLSSALPFILFLLISACTYGPEKDMVSIGNIAAKPQSHELAFTVDYRRIRDATGFAAFPNGGIPKVIAREARVYVCDIDRASIKRIAQVPDFGGIPNPGSVWIHGWLGGFLYFSLNGYGRDSQGGDDFNRPYNYVYRVSESGTLTRVDHLPDGVAIQRNTGPEGETPFLRYSRGRLDIEITADAIASGQDATARVIFPPGSTEPVLKPMN